MATLIKSVGFLLSLCPYFVLEGATRFLGLLFVRIPSERRRVLLSNLRYAFPGRPEADLLNTARESAARMFEMGFFSLCYPFLSKGKLRKTILYDMDAEAVLGKMRESEQPYVIMIPHVCLFETLATSPHFRPQRNRRLVAIYRPNKNKALDEWINLARQDVGIVTFSRKAGFAKTKEFLRNGNWLAILFDQNAGNQGTLTCFIDRLASITPLPDLLRKTANAKAIYACPKRVGFFQSSVELIELDTKKSISLESHHLLADQIKSHPLGFPDWLWPHSKWKTHYSPKVKFGLKPKRQLLPDKIPRKLVFFIHMPNWLGDIMMAAPLLFALSKARPDVKLILFCRPQYKDLLEFLGLGDEVFQTTNVFSLSGMKSFLRMRIHSPDCHLLLTNSFRGDLEAFISGSAHRFGLRRPRKPRPLLSHSFRANRSMLEGAKAFHQSKLWEEMMVHFGLNGKVLGLPFSLKGLSRDSDKIGVVAGSSNNPGKRWGVNKWISLISKLFTDCPSFQIYLYGTQEDLPISNEISNSFETHQIVNMTGRTNLCELASEFATCGLVIGNDTGGMHLANAVGTPAVVLYGPTNPIKTSPCFNSPKICVQPKGCPPDGGMQMNFLSARRAYKAVSKMLKP